jgi:D-alanyl-lipoteichoic acid acyltransferase DltB (MBOAT superfamily)
MSWKAEYGFILLLSTVVDYYCALQIERFRLHKSLQKRFLYLSLASNLGLLFFFKYFALVSENLLWIHTFFDTEVSWTTLKIIIPIGISFYTFQTVSYTVDVYRGEINAERNFAVFALYVSFFPQLVAGPIERAGHLLPQFNSRRSINTEKIISGLKLATFGFFKKMVVADNLAPFVNRVYDPQYSGSSLENLLATYAFTFLIYADFSGYTDIARGIARMMGFELMKNFRQPYFATSIVDFWRRWHVSLSFWLRDYVYIPLGGSRKGKLRTYANLMLTMILSGMWHGAAFHFIFRGFILALYIIVYKFFKDLKLQLGFIFGLLRNSRIINILFTFHLFMLGLIYFRAESVAQANTIIASFTFHLNDIFFSPWPAGFPYIGFVFTAILLGVDFVEEKYGLYSIQLQIPSVVRYLLYSALIFSILIFGVYKSSQFVYFQF